MFCSLLCSLQGSSRSLHCRGCSSWGALLYSVPIIYSRAVNLKQLVFFQGLTTIPLEGQSSPLPSPSGNYFPARDTVASRSGQNAASTGQKAGERFNSLPMAGHPKAGTGSKESTGAGPKDGLRYRPPGQGPYLMELGLPMPSLILPTRKAKLPPMDFMEAVEVLKVSWEGLVVCNPDRILPKKRGFACQGP